MIHLYYFMLIYSPIMLLKKITKTSLKIDTFVESHFCDFYYNKEFYGEKKYYFMSEKDKKILELFIESELYCKHQYMRTVLEGTIADYMKFYFYEKISLSSEAKIYSNEPYNIKDYVIYLMVYNNKIYELLYEDSDENKIYKLREDIKFLG